MAISTRILLFLPEHTFFQGCEDHTYSVYAVLDGNNVEGLSSEIVVKGELITQKIADTLRETTLSLPTCQLYGIVIVSGVQPEERSNPVVVRTRTKKALFEVSPGCNTYTYKVQIRAYPGNIEGPEVLIEKKTITSPIKPEELTVTSTGASAEAMVSWKYNAPCKATGYDVTVYDESGRIIRTERSTTEQIRIQRLPTCTHLFVGVRTRVDNISGPESEVKEVVINELQMIVEDLMVENVGDNYQKVTWKPAPVSSYVCRRNYVVTQLRAASNDQPTVVKVKVAEKSELIFNTHPGCNTYTYEIVPIEESTGETRGTPASLTRRSQPPKLHAPTGVEVEQQQGGLVKISWRKVNHEISCGVLTYAVYANKTMGNDYTRVPAAAIETEKVVQLDQCTDYIVYVESIRTMDNQIERVQSDAVRLRTKVEKPAPIVSLAVTESKATSQKLTWAAPTNQLKCAWYELLKEKASNSGHPVVVRLDLVDTSRLAAGGRVILL
ncbi:hypothetical protein X801_04101 [Opisthorchis viverrini]|uniref:Fibronectin type-III domain-containing protein n=1 Tax=Opisthorchis viverrini TaxID=6198 RepID=A0A1S8X046_OPIVI|nr:hypothetical protein X801_04101 [Opisthorchis viverrini]